MATPPRRASPDRKAGSDPGDVLLERTVEELRWRVHAYALMSNHYHLLFTTPQPNLSRGMQLLHGGYAALFNKRHHRVGHLFAGRFKGQLVDSADYLLEAARYVVLNPVRAGITQHAGDYALSSYRATAGMSPVPSWLDVDMILRRFDPADRVAAQRAYVEFVAAREGRDDGV